ARPRSKARRHAAVAARRGLRLVSGGRQFPAVPARTAKEVMATHSAETARDLVQMLRKAAPGDTVALNGSFGEVRLSGIRPEGRVTIRAAKPGAAHLERMVLAGCANLAFSGLT